MLAKTGVKSVSELYADVPQSVRAPELKLPRGLSEFEARAQMEALADENKIFRAIFRGAGAYDHFIPALVTSVVSKESFVTAYTPYQAEISQGLLQSIFEYQTMICELTGLDVSNASVYDGASAAAEAVAMCAEKTRSTAFVSAAANPMVIRTIQTYCRGSGTQVILIPEKDGATDISALRAMLGADAACVYIQQPNFYGIIEDAEALACAAHGAGAKFIMGVNPIAAAILKTPGECGADIAVGEGQPLGMPLAFGGPYLGFMAAKKALMRKLPGRIVGETTDIEGRRAFVLTLQAREQHIRREKASPTVGSTAGLCALRAAVIRAPRGPRGRGGAARQCAAKAHYLQKRLCAIKGVTLRYGGEFLHEFVTALPISVHALNAALEARGILGPLEIDGGALWCATEKNTKAQLDELITLVREVCAG